MTYIPGVNDPTKNGASAKYKTKWSDYLPLMILAVLVLLGIGLKNWLVELFAKPCASPEYMRMPVIEEFDSDRVVLSGSRYRLKKGDTYQFEGNDFTVRAKLLDITDSSATFFIEVRESYYVPSADPPYVRGPYNRRKHCKLVVTPDDDTYLSQFSDLQIRPIDLDKRWEIDQYTEHIDFRYYSLVPSISQTRILISATYDSVPYIISQDFYKYDSEDTANIAFDEAVEHADMVSGRETTNYPSLADNFFEACDRYNPDSCSYMAQYHEYLVRVTMYIPRSYEMSDNQIPVEDWHFLLSQVEARLTQ